MMRSCQPIISLIFLLASFGVARNNPFDHGYYVPKDVYRTLDSYAPGFEAAVREAAVPSVSHDAVAKNRALEKSLIFVPIYKVNTDSPTFAPSDVPSELPSVSMEPSDEPSAPPSLSAAPSEKPSTQPSVQPSSEPSSLPTNAPIMPSAGPSQTPSTEPTMMPSGSPTKESFKTKNATLAIRLDGLESELPEDAIASFEAVLFEFLRVHISGYEIRNRMDLGSEEEEDGPVPYTVDMMSVTFISQEFMEERRVLNSDEDKSALFQPNNNDQNSTIPYLLIDCEVVGEIIIGVVPAGYDLADDVLAAIEEFQGDLYRRLARANLFFQPGLQMFEGSVSGAEAIPEDPSSQIKFLVAIICAVIAFLIASGATWYAVRRHLEKKRAREAKLKRRTRLSHMTLSDDLEIKRTVDEPLSYSEDHDDEDDDDDDDDDKEGSRSQSLQLDVDKMVQEMENGLAPTPSSILSSMFPRRSDGYVKTPTSEQESVSSFADKEDDNGIIKKWMTPRRPSNDDSVVSSHVDDTVVKDAEDPPEDHKTSSLRRRSPKTISGHPSQGNYEINTKRSSANTPLGSLVSSTANNFFMKVGSVFGRSTPRETAPKKEDDLRQIQPAYWSGSEAGASDFPESEAGYNAEHLMYDGLGSGSMDNYSLEKFRTHAATHVIKSHIQNDWEDDDDEQNMEELQIDDDQDSEFFSPSTVLGARPPSIYHNYEAKRQPLVSEQELTPPAKNSQFTLGARPMADTEKDQYNEKRSIDNTAKRAGLYDVFAPSGPIGIVVDTTDEGPSVHSVKRTSPMLGLINPGDLIVALDDEDTRNMSAAALTRLMARKSRQKERKISLVAMDGY